MSRAGLLVGYGVPPAAAVAATWTWFTPGRFIAAGDVPPYLRDGLAAEVPALWNHQVTGAGSTSYAVTQALDVALIRLAGTVGGSPTLAQHWLYALVCGLAGFGTAYLAGAWIRHPVARATAGLLGAFNVFLLVNYLNPLPTLAVGVTGVLVGLLLRAADGRRMSALLFATATLPVSYLAQNPPLVAVVALALGTTLAPVAAVRGARAVGNAAGLLGRAAPWTVLIHLWWLVPCGLTLVGGAGLTFTAQTDVAAWAWTHARSSIGNVLTLNGHWGWPQREYFPYARDMSTGVEQVLRWLPPLLALAGVLLADRRRRRAAWLVAAALVILAFLAKGIHPPLGTVNLWLFEHVPGMWLFRDPMSKLGVLLVLGYAVLAGLAVERTIALATRLQHPWRRVVPAVAGAVVLAAVGYPWPLWTGDVTPQERGLLPGTRVTVPDSWRTVAAEINADASPGKVLMLPTNSYYQVHTTWDYYGADAVPAQLFRRPVLHLLPGGYFTADPAVRAQLAGVESALLAGDRASVPARLRALGVRYLVVRHDLRSSPYAAPPADPRHLERVLAGTEGIRLTGRYRVASVYRMLDRPGTVQAYPALAGVGHTDLADLASVVGSLGGSHAVATDPDLPVSVFRWRADAAGRAAFTVARTGRYRLDRRPVGAVAYHASVVRRGPAAWLELADRNTVLIDGRPLPPRRSLRIRISDPSVAALLVDGRAVPLPRSGSRVGLDGTTTVTAYAPARPTRNLLGRFGALGNCNRHDNRTSTQAGLTLTRTSHEAIRLSARAHSACTSAPVAPASSGLYRVRLSYRNLTGNPARLCLWQERLQQCAPLPAADGGPGLRYYTGVVPIGPGAGPLHLFLYADGEPTHTTVEYRNVVVEPLERVGQATVDPDPVVTNRRLAAGRHVVEFHQPGDAGPPSAMQDCHSSAARIELDSQARLQRLPDGGIELSAQGGVACVWADPGTATTGTHYRVTVEYQALSGRPPRLCVWQVGPDRCADTPPLEPGEGWRRLTTTVRPAAGTRGLRLYLYADGQRNPLTRVRYRGATIGVASPETLVVTGRPATGRGGPEVATTSYRPGRHQVRIRGASGRFALTLAESYAPGWRLTGLPRGWRAVHFTANGYANGWLITGTGDATLTLEYRPGRWAARATAVSIVAVCAACLVPLWRNRPCRRRRSPAEPAPSRPCSGR